MKIMKIMKLKEERSITDYDVKICHIKTCF